MLIRMIRPRLQMRVTKYILGRSERYSAAALCHLRFPGDQT